VEEVRAGALQCLLRCLLQSVAVWCSVSQTSLFGTAEGGDVRGGGGSEGKDVAAFVAVCCGVV